MTRIIIYIALAVATFVSAKENTKAQAQVQAVGTIKIGDANMLPSMPITEAIIQVKRVYGVDMQFFYQAIQGTPSSVRLAEYKYKHYIIPSTYNPGWYWTTLRVPVDATNVMNLDSVNAALGYDKITARQSATANLNTRVMTDSLRLINETARAIAAEATKQPAGTYLSSYTEIDPLYTTNGATKAYANSLATRINADSLRLVAEAAAAERLANKVSTYSATNTSSTQYPSFSALQLALATTVRGVTLGGGSATFTTTSLLVNGTVSVTIPLGVTMPDVNYQVTTPTVIGSGGVNLLGNLAINSITKNASNVVVVLRNTALLAVAVSGTIDIVAIKVNQ